MRLITLLSAQRHPAHPVSARLRTASGQRDTSYVVTWAQTVFSYGTRQRALQYTSLTKQNAVRSCMNAYHASTKFGARCISSHSTLRKTPTLRSIAVFPSPGQISDQDWETADYTYISVPPSDGGQGYTDGSLDSGNGHADDATVGEETGPVVSEGVCRLDSSTGHL